MGFKKASFTVPVGPLRCLAMLAKALVPAKLRRTARAIAAQICPCLRDGPTDLFQSFWFLNSGQ
jgi:hypothetical protein